MADFSSMSTEELNKALKSALGAAPPDAQQSIAGAPNPPADGNLSSMSTEDLKKSLNSQLAPPPSGRTTSGSMARGIQPNTMDKRDWKIQYPNYPTIAEMEIPGALDPSWKNSSWSNILAAKFGPSFTSDPEAARKILLENLPGVEAKQDVYGNLGINYQGKGYYIDKPGFNARDLSRMINPISAATMLAAVPTAGMSIPATAAIGSGISGLTSIAEDAAAKAAGSGKDIDWGNAAKSAAVGFAAPLAQTAISGAITAGRNFTGLGNNVTTLNPNARDLMMSSLKREGTNPQNIQNLHPDFTLAEANRGLLAEAQGAVRQNPGGMSPLVETMKTRNEGVNKSLNQNVNSILGPEGLDQKTYSAALREEGKAVVDPIYKNVWETAKPVESQSIVSKIDELLAKTEPTTAEGRLLANIRSKLVAQPAQPGTPAQRIPRKLPNGTIYETKPATTPTPEQYVSDPQILHSVKYDLGQILKFGDPEMGIVANSVKNGAGKTVYGELNGLLKNKVPRYEEATNKAEEFINRVQGVKQGYELFRGGENATHPTVFNDIIKEGNIGDITAGARARISNALGTKENDLSALRDILKGSGDFNRQNLERLYGKEAVDRLAGEVSAKSQMRTNYGKIASGSETATNLLGAERVVEGGKGINTASIVPKESNVFGLTGHYGLKGLDATSNAVRNFGKGEYYSDLATRMGLQGAERDAFVKRLFADEERRRGVNRRAAGSAAFVPGLLGQNQ